MRKVEGRISHLQTQHSASGEGDFCDCSASRAAEAHQGKCSGLCTHSARVMMPSWLTGTCSLELCFCLLSPGGFEHVHVTAQEDGCNHDTGQRAFQREREESDSTDWEGNMRTSKLGQQSELSPECLPNL